MEEGYFAAAQLFATLIIEGWRDWFAGKLDRTKRRALREMLLDRRYSLRTIAQLSARVGLDEAGTRNLLIEIGARPDEIDANQWGFDRRIRQAAKRKARSKISN